MKTIVLVVLSAALPALFPTQASSAPTGQAFNVRDFGAAGDGKTLDTVAIQKALDDCGKAGGGTVLLPAGTYLSQPLTIRTRTTLQLDKGATLQATDDPADYQRADKPDSFLPFLAGKDLEDVTIAGEGVIDGGGQKWWVDAEAARQKKSGYTLPRPNMIVLTRVTNLVVRDVTLQNAPKFHLVPTECDGVEVTGVTILAPERSPNTDGIDPSMCRRVTITRCLIDVGDDNIAIKSGKKAEGREFACEDYKITECTFKHGHGMSIGSEIVGGVRNVLVKDCTFEDTDNGIRIKTDRSRGGAVENIVYENIRMKNVRGAIFIAGYYPKIPAEDETKPVKDTTPKFRGITIRNFAATSTKGAGAIVGLPESPIEDVTLENVNIEAAQAGLEIRNARGVTLKNVKVTPKKGAPIIVKSAEVAGLAEQGGECASITCQVGLSKPRLPGSDSNRLCGGKKHKPCGVRWGVFAYSGGLQFLAESPLSMSVDSPQSNSTQQPHRGVETARLPIEAGVYRTAPRRIGLLARTFPSTVFYLKFAVTVLRASRQAKRSNYDSVTWARSSHEVLHELESVGVRVEVTGVDYLEQLDTPFVVIGNHMSTLETAVLPGVIQPVRDVTFVVKKALVDMPVFKYVMRSRNPIVVAQTNARDDLKVMLTEGSDRLQRGMSVVVFPEGRRSPTFNAPEFNTIGVKLAHRNGVPLVPLALKTDAWALGRRYSDIGRIDPTKTVHFAFGKPVWVDGRGTDENRAVIEFIESKLRDWQASDA